MKQKQLAGPLMAGLFAERGGSWWIVVMVRDASRRRARARLAWNGIAWERGTASDGLAEGDRRRGMMVEAGGARRGGRGLGLAAHEGRRGKGIWAGREENQDGSAGKFGLGRLKEKYWVKLG
ncbi:hypothetical protein Droror1_Dr00013119 [Drosera rotundifolia]